MDMKLKNYSIKWRLFLFLMAFTAILIVFLWIFQVVSLDSFYRYVKLNETKSFAANIIKNIDSQNLQDVINDISMNNEIGIEIISQNGDYLYSSESFRDNLLGMISISSKIALYERARQNNNVYIEYIDQGTEPVYMISANNNIWESRMHPLDTPIYKTHIPQSIIYVQIFSDKQENQKMLMINSRISPVDATVKTLRTQIMYITVLMVVLSIIMALLISRIISKPIVAINNSAKELAKGDYDIRFEGKDYREIAELSDTLNYAAKELGKVEGLRRELLANVSHDLRTPLTLITGYSEAMKDLPGENTPENAQVIIDESKRLTELVNDMLDLTKMQSGVQKTVLRKLNFTSLVIQIVERFAKFCDKEGYQIQLDYDHEIHVMADSVKINQVVYNLLCNAINYTGEDKRVFVRQNVFQDKVRLEITDTGDGIEPESIPYIWERYYKVDKAHKRAMTGTGLGLFIVKSMLDLHEGSDYGVVSQPGQGSTFWIELPIIFDKI